MESAREKLKNLLIILLDAIASQNEELDLDLERIREMCSIAGYPETSISGILAWLQTQWPSHDGGQALWSLVLSSDAPVGRGVRAFGEDERDYLTPPAFGYLLDLCQEGLISRQQMELLIHYASLVSELPLKRQEIDHLLDQVFFRFPEQGTLDHPTNGLGNIH